MLKKVLIFLVILTLVAPILSPTVRASTEREWRYANTSIYIEPFATYPDLIVTEIDIIPGPSNDYFFSAYIKNQGPVSTAAWGSFDVSWWIDSNYMGEEGIDVIAAGQTINRNTHWYDATSGWHTVKFHVDYWDFIPESIQNNNDRSENFYVEPSGYPDLIVIEIDMTPASPYHVGNTISFTANIRNQGPVSTAAWGSFDVSYWIDSNYLGELDIGVIDAEQTIYRSFSWVASSSGWHTVKFHVDYFDYIPESDQNNNDRSENFYVETLQIVSLEYPSEVTINQDFSLNVNIQYSLSATTTVRIQVYEHAGPLLGSTQDSLSGSGSKTYPFTLTAPSTPNPDWQLNIHLFYWNGEWIQTDIESIHIVVSTGTQGVLEHFDLDYHGIPPDSDGSDQGSITVNPSTTQTLFFYYKEGNAGNNYIVRVYPEWDKNNFIANSDNDESISEVGMEIGGQRWDKEAYTAPSTPGTYKIRVVYSASSTPPTWYTYDRLLAEGTIVVQEVAQPPVLSEGYVTPPSGDTSKLFQYYVRYYDPDGDSPTQKVVCIDMTQYHTMNLYSGSASNGVYRYILTLPVGDHNYYFKFSDGEHVVQLPSSGSYSGPTVHATLTVYSAHDSPDPSTGPHTYNDGDMVICSVTSPVKEGGITYVCTGWSGTGSVPAVGTDTSTGTFVIHQDSTITWNWKDLLPDLDEETISDTIVSADVDGDGRPDFGWNSGYDITFVDQALHIEINIELVGDDPGDALRQQWETGIEGIWSNSYDIVDGTYAYPIEVEVNWVTANPHHVITVHSGTGRSNMLNWYTDKPGGWGNEYQDEVAAHEAGHMLGLYDEYEDGALDPDTLFTTTDSLMADLGPTKSWHYDQILEWLETGSGRDLSLAQSPLPPFPIDDPIPDFNDPQTTKVGDFGGGLPPRWLNFDAKVDGLDLALFIEAYKGLAPPEVMYLADLGGGLPPQFFEYDGVVDGIDLALFIACYKGLGP